MKNKIILIMALLFSSAVFAQNAIPTTKAEFTNHIPAINFIVKKPKRQKQNGLIKFKAAKKTIILKDDGEFRQYNYEGDLENYPIAVVNVLEPNSEKYYFINKLTGHIDTLLDKPIFYSDKKHFICLEGWGTDTHQRIQVGELKRDNSITKTFIKLSGGPFIPMSYIFWYNLNTVFISDNNNKFYKLNLKQN